MKLQKYIVNCGWKSIRVRNRQIPINGMSICQQAAAPI